MTASRLLAAVVTVLVIILALVAGFGAGNFLVTIGMLTACGIFWIVELKFQKGSAAYALQYLLTRSLTALVVTASGVYFAYLGVSELSAPVTFPRRYEVMAQAIRDLIGSNGVAVLLLVLGGTVLFHGVRMFPHFFALSTSRRGKSGP